MTPSLHLTWAGFDAAVDLIAAQCRRDLTGVCGMDRGGEVLAWALSERLGIECAGRPASGGLLVWGLVEQRPRARCADAVVWAWVDASPGHRVQSAMKATPGTQVLMPWQDASACRRAFLPGFDD